MATVQKTDELSALEQRLVENNLRGQWQIDANRPQNVLRGPQGQVWIEPMPAGAPHIWRWQTMRPLLDAALHALTESYTARRTLVLTNPKLMRGTTQTMVASVQIIRPGELAWAHRHTINAIRFAIQGNSDVFTVVDGEPLAMEPYDLLLTPGWSWHDHHNQSDKPAIWLDALDVPFTLALNQNFYEELGESAQEQTRDAAPAGAMARMSGNASRSTVRPMRYAWADTLRSLKAAAGETVRRTSSTIHFVVQGEGRTVVDQTELDWGQHDSFVVPNWSWHQHINPSKSEPAILFTLSDVPILEVFGLYREETRETNSGTASPR